MAAIDDVERFFRHLVDILSESDPGRLKRPIQVSEIYQSILPYRHHRSALGFDTNEDYEMAVLRFLSGDGGFASLDPPEVQDALAEESRSVNPNPSAFREYAAARIYLNAGAYSRNAPGFGLTDRGERAGQGARCRQGQSGFRDQ